MVQPILERESGLKAGQGEGEKGRRGEGERGFIWPSPTSG